MVILENLRLILQKAIGIRSHLGRSVGIVTDVEDHRLGSFVESHAGLLKQKQKKADSQGQTGRPTQSEPHCFVDL